MTDAEIAELFIRAAEVDRRLPDTARPARLKAMSLPYVHTRQEMNEWGTERLEEWRAEFWSEYANRIPASSVSEWERAMDLMALVEDESQRRCLWAWARAKAGGRPFAHWCRHEEHIAEITGQRRKNRAISQIAFHFARKGLQNKQNAENGVLPDAPEIDHIAGNIAEPRRTSWMADGAFSPIPRPEFRDFSWAAKMAERRRRKREAKKRQMDEVA